MHGSRRLARYYVVLALLTAAVFSGALSKGSGETSEPGIRGGYDVRSGAACLGPAFDVEQSGRFVSLDQQTGPLRARLRFEDGALTGTVSCVDGRDRPLAARVAEGELTGAAGDVVVAATLKRDPPAAGAPTRVPADVGGEYQLAPRSDCVGGQIELAQHGRTVHLEPRDGAASELTYTDGLLSGPVRCRDGTTLALAGSAVDRKLTLTLTAAGDPATAPPPVRLVATEQREFTAGLAVLFLAIALVMLAARGTGALAARIGQPRVMGEVVAGIALGPTLFGAIVPGLQSAVFPSDVIPWIGVAANLGLIFYMFLVGLEIDLGQLKGRVGQTAAISNTGVLVPMAAGVAVALPLYPLLGPPKAFIAFALFMGVSMSITAFPVLARILVERRMLKRPLGALALASAAIDDVSAWFLIAVASAVATAGSFGGVAGTIGLAVAFCLVMVLVVRRVLARMAVAYDEAGTVPGGWIVAIFAGVLLSAWATEEIGIALIFGAFVMGAVMPRHAGLTEDVTHRIEDFVATLLLPLFFCYTGLKTNVGLIDSWALVAITLGLILVAVLCKFGGCFIAARATGLGTREAAVIGALMNTRGLTELIVLNLALEKGVLSEALFTMLVLMALVTTFMTGPLLRLLDPDDRYGAPVGEELDEARGAAPSPVPVPDHSVLLAPHSDAALAQLVAIGAPLARSVPERELVIVRLVEPSRGVSVRGGLQSQNRLLAQANAGAAGTRGELRARGIAARSAAILSTAPGRDLVKLADRDGVDLLLIDGRRPLLGGGVPRGEIGDVLREAACDVGVLVARDDATLALGADAAVVVPFGGAPHDWAALELGAWIAARSGAPLRLLGAGDGEAGHDPSRLLASASLVVQQLAGVDTEPVLAEPGQAGMLAAAADAGLLVIGLSERWREEGLGGTRSQIASAAPAPVLFVRRGRRPGALAPDGQETRFSWSSAGLRESDLPGIPPALA